VISLIRAADIAGPAVVILSVSTSAGRLYPLYIEIRVKPALHVFGSDDSKTALMNLKDHGSPVLVVLSQGNFILGLPSVRSLVTHVNSNLHSFTVYLRPCLFTRSLKSL